MAEKLQNLMAKKQTTLKEVDAKQAYMNAIEKEEQFELSDIFEGVNGQNIKKVVEDNIIYILKREKMLPKRWSVVIPEGGYDYQIGKKDVRFAGDFEIFSDPMTIFAYGSVVTQGQLEEIITMTINITKVVGYPNEQNKLRFF